ncbi:unnamed protein product [Spirodela intermedia]|uniref:J domain-containing protein n=1 Tax=Spirodela intermedia TaxID=51605 RepID=A0A7I8J2L9_SPIIN|nr:unnamed protein product [Spirodela intermedia]CAA6664455.1 unnamed protein product [Spirodela intermedia]
MFGPYPVGLLESPVGPLSHRYESTHGCILKKVRFFLGAFFTSPGTKNVVVKKGRDLFPFPWRENLDSLSRSTTRYFAWHLVLPFSSRSQGKDEWPESHLPAAGEGVSRPACFSGCGCRARFLGIRPSSSPCRSPSFALFRSSGPVFSPPLDSPDLHRAGQRRTIARASNWASEKSPYETLELDRDADEEKIKSAYRRLAKYYHPDVYDGRGTLEEGETAEARFIKIQAAYELLVDDEKRREYDRDHRVNPKSLDGMADEEEESLRSTGDMAIAAWAEQQQRELNLRARRLAKSKIDPEEERRILARERRASMENFSNTLKRHTLVLKKRDLMRNKAEEDKRRVISQLLAAEGLELDTTQDDENL